MDVDLWGDGVLWTLYVFEEDLEWCDERRYVKPGARIVEIKRQTPLTRFIEVRVRQAEIEKLRTKYAYRRGEGD